MDGNSGILVHNSVSKEIKLNRTQNAENVYGKTTLCQRSMISHLEWECEHECIQVYNVTSIYLLDIKNTDQCEQWQISESSSMNKS